MFADRVRAGRMIVVPLALAGALLLGACSSDDSAEATETATAETQGAVETVTVTGIDYGYEGLPATAAVGTTLAFTNASDTELHELVALRLPDGETRTIAELLALSEEEQAALLAAAPTMVLIARPGEDAIPVVGTGELAESGRYLFLCAIPAGANPDEYLAAAATSDGPPQVAGGPPHFTFGMFGEVTVE
jgi:plastocyanin